ncbi:hypothetical protein [Streptomyces griseorubiginosus]|uniref:hypothetical protein n=1 Tax=Streptomyces griseorubiginosus TaxID=67304 RepID=UPI003657CC3F
MDPYLDYLRQRWEEGEHTAKVLHRELLAKDYRGHYQRVKTAVAPPRRGLHTIERLDRLLTHCPELNAAPDLLRDFAALLDAKDAAPLPD